MNKNDLQSIKRHYRIVGRDEKLDRALDTALQVANTDLSVLIQGESGVGKEIIPRLIHENSRRSRERYLAINCGSIPEGTIDSELFGHEKGAYTGAIGEREGYFGAANGGTLFLDEVGELPLSTQARLLRVLETGEYLRVGSNQPQKTDVRIVAATNVDIPSAIREGLFREDLYYRLCTINVKVPPLRERGRDVVLLFNMFARETAEKYNIPEPIYLTPEAEEIICSYRWPGNIRQLKNITEQLSILAEERNITPQTLQMYGIVPHTGDDTSMAPWHRGGEHHSHNYDNEVKFLASAVFELRKEVDRLQQMVVTGHGMDNTMEPAMDNRLISYHPDGGYASPESFSHMPSTTKENFPHMPATPTVEATYYATEEPQNTYDEAEEVPETDTLNIEKMERRFIVKALQKSRNRRKVAAQMLGISERTLYRKIKDYNIEE